MLSLRKASRSLFNFFRSAPNPSLPTISFNRIRAGLLWINNWYDGELAGVAMLDGRRVYFDLIEELEPHERRFAVYDLPAEVWAVEDERHADFLRYVGNHWDYRDGKSKISKMQLKEEWSKFYDKWSGHQRVFDSAWQIAIADSRYK